MSMLLMDATGERVAFVECKWGRNVDVSRLIRRLREKARTVARFVAASHETPPPATHATSVWLEVAGNEEPLSFR